MTKDALRKVTWEHRMAAYKSSGQSARRWCAENGVNVTQLYYWLKKESTPAEQAWLPVEIK
ncbi:MAG: helix-turn-helix domain-containing protein, partial [Thermaerobacter sp.]|nr:helix-turn-helix domain-containing protein [Thermaerobacter sp.]